MKNFKLADFLNSAILYFALSLVIFAWTKKLLDSKVFALILTISIIFILATELAHLKKQKINRLNLKKSEIKFQEQIMWHFLTTPKAETLAFLKNALKNKYTLTKTTNYLKDESEKLVVFACFETKTLTELALLKCLQQAPKTINTIIIFCGEFNDSLSYIVKNSVKKIVILNAYETYGLLKNLNTFPIEKTEIVAPKKSHINASTFFSAANTKPFIWCALMLYFSSFFIIYNVYYITIASLCLIFAFVCKFFAKPTTKTSNFELLLSKEKTQN